MTIRIKSHIDLRPNQQRESSVSILRTVYSFEDAGPSCRSLLSFSSSALGSLPFLVPFRSCASVEYSLLVVHKSSNAVCVELAWGIRALGRAYYGGSFWPSCSPSLRSDTSTLNSWIATQRSLFIPSTLHSRFSSALKGQIGTNAWVSVEAAREVWLVIGDDDSEISIPFIGLEASFPFRISSPFLFWVISFSLPAGTLASPTSLDGNCVHGVPRLICIIHIECLKGRRTRQIITLVAYTNSLLQSIATRILGCHGLKVTYVYLLARDRLVSSDYFFHEYLSAVTNSFMFATSRYPCVRFSAL